MKRKLIRQGGAGLTMYLPKKWVDEKNLSAGDEVEVDTYNENLIISTTGIKQKPKELILVIPNIRESAIRTLLANAYRAGFDKMNVTFDGKSELLRSVVEHNLLGFEVFEKGKNTFCVESVSEPNHDNAEVLIHRQLYMIEEILKNLGIQPISDDVQRVMKYDNFLKRCISKQIINPIEKQFLWQFLNSLTHTARMCLYITKDMTDHKTKIGPEFFELLKEVLALQQTLKQAYLKQDWTLLPSMHTEEQHIRIRATKFFANKPFMAHWILMLSRIVYLANSPLTGVLQMRLAKNDTLHK